MRPHTWTTAEAALFKERWAGGASFSELADLFGCSVKAARHFRARLSLEPYGNRRAWRRSVLEEAEEHPEEISRPCTRCGVEQPLTAFNRSRRGKAGRIAWCRECCRAYNEKRKQNKG